MANYDDWLRQRQADEAMEREAERHGLSPDAFREQFRVVAHYNAFDGVLYTFEEIPSDGEAGTSR